MLQRAPRPSGVPLWIVGQTHGADFFGLREPSREEVRDRYRLARNAGATGMFWFVYTSQQGWRGLKDNPDLLDEIGKIARGLASGPVLRCPGPDAHRDPARPQRRRPARAGQLGARGRAVVGRPPMNPAAPGGIPVGGIRDSASPVRDVKHSYGGNIQAAIDACPLEGCTLFFRNGTYRNDWQILARSNIHFKGESREGVILSGDPWTPIGGVIKGCQAAFDYAAFDLAVEQGSTAALSCGMQRSRNFSFTDLTFDGAHSPVTQIESDHRMPGIVCGLPAHHL